MGATTAESTRERRNWIYNSACRVAPRVPTRRHPDHPPEPVREVALIRKPNPMGNLDQRQTTPDQPLRLPDAHALQVCMRWQPHLCPEHPRQVEWAKTGHCSKLG